MSCVVTCRSRVLSSCTGLASEFGDLNAEEIKLHAEVDIDGGASAMVISEIALHELDRVRWVRDEHFGHHVLKDVIHFLLDIHLVFDLAL